MDIGRRYALGAPRPNNMDIGWRYALGTPLLQVFSVTITKNDESERCSQVCGAIRVTDEHDTNLVLYKRDLCNSETINSDGALTLTGPPIGISALTPFTIHVDLTSTAQDLEINRKICWNPKDTFYYDKLLSIDLQGKSGGYATLNCAIFSVAKAPVVEIVLSREKGMDGESNIEIYGSLVARCVNIEHGDDSRNFHTILFNHSAENCVNIELGKTIPLSRSVLVLPACSSLVIEGDLYLGGTRCPILTVSTGELVPSNCAQIDVVGVGFVALVTVFWRCPIGDKYYY